MYRIASPNGTGVYTALGDGLVEVERDGRTGRFDANGVWLSGELRVAEPGMCRWMSTHGTIGTRHAASVSGHAPTEGSPK
jgi:hypothetical protein